MAARRGWAVPALFQPQLGLLKRQAPRQAGAPSGTTRLPPRPESAASACDSGAAVLATPAPGLCRPQGQGRVARRDGRRGWVRGGRGCRGPRKEPGSGVRGRAQGLLLQWRDGGRARAAGGVRAGGPARAAPGGPGPRHRRLGPERRPLRLGQRLSPGCLLGGGVPERAPQPAGAPGRPLVTSFTGKYGSIQYCVRAVLERPKVPDQSVKRELQVVSHVDVNTPALLTPVLKTQEKMVGCWFFTSGPVSLSAKIERKGYCNGEAIPIYAEIENCSSRLIVPKAAIFQTQTYLASGKTKTIRHMVANVRGNHIASGSTDTWNGKTLKIPPVTPSILDCCIIRVDYSLAVYIHIPGAKKLMLELPLVIGTIPYNGFGSRNSSIASQFSMDMSWLTLTLPEQPEAPPNYADVVSEEEFSRHIPSYPQPPNCEGEVCCPMFACIQEFRFQPPPLYAEVDPHPSDVEETQPVSFIL
ncbi:arrestin domain-containing protein 4 isoform X1 [Papio anubis]|uniref:Arrestin C-terminal-like domain-containing protein n=1 Tax=Papio anubis TaxID=9555 RepID=A0A8I5MY69_PAPAN|nr:arrestin domain-containing protein 4 isoform X1 [Papio anubis]XP_031524168.1 arrestin domain-containing protein 4 isoform X1 [Papio anubis]